MNGHGRINAATRVGLAAILGALLLAVTAALGVSGAATPTPASDNGDPAPDANEHLPKGVKVSRELATLRTKTSRTYETDDGRRLTKLFLEPVNYRDANGDWQKIDTRLQPDQASTLTTEHTDFDLSLPKELDSGSVRVADGDNVAAFSLEGAAASSAKIDGSSAHFPNALEGVDVDYTAGSDSLKETLSLKDAEAPNSYTFKLRLSDGLTPKKQKDGSVALEDADGQQQMLIPAPTVADASGATTDKIAYTVARSDEDYELKVAVDKDWLASDKREFPVKVDPSVYTDPLRDCTIKSSAPTTSFCSAATNEAGNYGGSDSRSLFAFDIDSAIPKGARISNSWLYQNVTAKATSTTQDFGVYRLTKPFAASATWNSAATGTAWSSPGGDIASGAYKVHAFNGSTTLPYDDYYAPLSQLLQEWRDGTQPNYGFMLKGEAAVNKLTTDSSEATATGSHRPYLAAVWDYRPGMARQFSEASQKLSDRIDANVNIANGNLTVRGHDLHLAGTGMDLDIGRNFNGRTDFADTKLGPKWRSSAGGGVMLQPESGYDKLFIDETGAGHLFHGTGGGNYVSPTGINATLSEVGSELKIAFDQTKRNYFFNYDGDLLRETDRNGNTITYTYSATGKLASISDTRGQTTSVTYDANGRVQKLTDPAARTYTYGYDGSGRLSSYTDPAGKGTSYAYDGSGNLSEIQDPRGKVTRMEYDSSGRVTDLKRGYNRTSGAYVAKTHYAYSSPSAPCDGADTTETVVTDPRGNATTYCFDKELRAVKVVDAKGHSRSSSYNANSDVQSSNNAGATTTTNWDSQTHDLKGGTKPNGETYSLTYGSGSGSSPHQPSTYTSAQGSTTQYAYSGEGNLTGVTNGASPSQIQAMLEYNGQSGGSCTNDPTTKPGTLRCAIDGRANKTTYGYDSQGRLTRITPPSPIGQTTLTYDSAGRVKTIKDGKAQTTTYTYDNLDRTTRIDFQDGSYVAYGYDDDGNRTSRTDSVSGSTTWEYDDLNRRSKDTLPGAKVTTYGWDAASNLASLTDLTGATGYGYDQTNQLSSLTEPGGAQSTFEYDNRDNRTKTTFPAASGLTETRTYDPSDKVTSIRAQKGSATPLTNIHYTYTDPQVPSRETELVQQMNDTNGTTVNRYDDLDRLKTSVVTNSAKVVTDDRSYTYDASSNRLTETINGATTSFGYGAANQLCWKAAGTQSTASTDICPLTPTGATTYSFDANGNRTGSSDGGIYVYNARNQTTSIKPNSAGSATTQTYAGEGQGDLTGSGALGFQTNLLGIGVETGDTFGRGDFVREPDGTLFSQLQNGERRYDLQDALGSVVNLATDTGGSAGQFKYDPWGRMTATGQTSSWFFLYAGGLPINGSYHFGQRYYNTGTGVWTQADPLDQPGDLTQANRYQYGADDPVNITDPAGTCIVLSCKTWHRAGEAGTGLAEAGGGAALAGASLVGFGACEAGTDAIGTLHCAHALYPPFVLGAGAVGHGAYRTYKAFR